MQVVHSTLINPVMTVLEGSLIACSHTGFHHVTILKSVSSCLMKTSDSASCPFLRFTFSCLQPPTLFIIHLPVPAGKKLHALVMIAASYCPVFKQEMVNELCISESCGCTLIVEECPAPRPSWSFCDCMYVSVPLTS